MQIWLLALHIPSVALWWVALFVITMVLTAHAQEKSEEVRRTLSRLEMGIFKKIVHPAAAFAVITGVLLALGAPGYLRMGWLHAKLLLVLFLVGMDLKIYFHAKAVPSSGRLMGEGARKAWQAALAVVFLAIVILAVVKPF